MGLMSASVLEWAHPVKTGAGLNAIEQRKKKVRTLFCSQFIIHNVSTSLVFVRCRCEFVFLIVLLIFKF